MQRYREALNHLNAALDMMVEEGDTQAIATVAHPIALMERRIQQRQTTVIVQHFGDGVRY